jgi:hypothetical protein
MMTVHQLKEITSILKINCLSVDNFYALTAHTKAENVSKKAIETNGTTVDFLPAILYADNGGVGHVGIAIGGPSKYKTCYDNDTLYRSLLLLAVEPEVPVPQAQP